MNTASSKWANYLIITFMICLLLYYGGNIVMPFIFSVFISLLLLPVVNFLERRKFPVWLSSLLAVLSLTILICGVGFFLYLEIDQMVKDLPETVKSNTGAVQQASAWFADLNIAENIERFSTDIVTNSADYLQQIITYISSTVMMMVTIPVYVFFMLVYRDRAEAFIELKFAKNIDSAKSVAQSINQSVRNYISGLFFVILTVGVLLSTGLYFLGIPYWLLLGILCALLTLLPYIGVVLGALLPITIAVLTKDSLFYPVAVLGLFILVQFLEGNLITPKIVGNAVNINPVILMLGLLIMGALSGIMGLVLTIPILAVLRILFNSSEELKPFGKLMANED